MDFTKLNETDVREEIIAPLIRELGYRSASEHNVLREQSLRYPRVYLGRKDSKKDPVLRGKADYILEAGGEVRWVIEAKAPSCAIDADEIEQAWTYANHPEVRAVYFSLCNGKRLLVYQTNRGAESQPILSFDYEQLSDQDVMGILLNVLSPNRLVKNPLIFPLTHGCRDFFVLKSVMTSSFKRFAPVSRAFYSPEAVCGRFSGVLHPRWAHSTPVSA
ncbi:type I restriction enzyme HsdR N-terminal domain-containing protein [Methylomonas sp. DH-1]|uniref:type I restriction enzyme HsdR N-terminal domain-containing protein n=1 Tax=Methylomonas sp. (strain DH-1) TaxID=1727196 RepID=UPI0009ED424A|nr:type I restriction enzyme HsdR N-terminal domain-containing protein [Methylomonas sp. DH-1]